MADSHQKAMLHMLEKLGGQGERLIGSVKILSPPEWQMSSRANWPELLHCTEQDILDALADYTFWMIDSLREDAGSCDTEISQAIARGAAAYRESAAAQDLARRWAREIWELYKPLAEGDLA